MRFIYLSGALALALSACGQAKPDADAPAQKADNAVYSGKGTVTAASADKVSISHDPIAGIGWPAMTMTFQAEGNLATGFRAGDKVAFAFRKTGQSYTLTSLTHAE